MNPLRPCPVATARRLTSRRLGRTTRAALAAFVTSAALGVAAPDACAASATPADSLAQLGTMSLDSLLDVEVTAASKFPQRVGESATSATVITAAEIRALGHRTLADVLRTIRGLSVGSDRMYSFLSVRGMSAPGDYNTRVLLLIDGIRVNDSVYDQALLGSEFPVDLGTVDRVEFIPGQGSAVHGANALFGVINVVTRKLPGAHGARGNGASGWIEAGSGRHRAASATLDAAGVDGRGLMLSATVSRRAGASSLYFAGFDDPGTQNGISQGADAEDSKKLLMKFDAGSGLTGTLIHANRRKGIPAALGTVFGDPGNAYRDATTLGALEYDTRADDHTDLKARLYAGQYRFRGDYRVDYLPDNALNVDRANARWWGTELSAVTTRFEGHKLAVGVDLQSAPQRDQRNADETSPATVYLDDHRRGRRMTVYAEDQFEVTPRLTLIAGARYDHTRDGERSGSAFSPRLAVVYRPDERLVLKYIHGSAFRPANAYERYYAVPGLPDYKGNPALRDESVRGHEFALDWRPTPATRFSASVYSNQARELIVQTIDPADDKLVFGNQGSLRTRGLEVEGEVLLADAARLRANYSFQQIGRPVGLSAGNVAPRHIANAIAVVPLPIGWTAGVQLGVLARRGAAPGHALLHLTLSTTRPWNGWDVLFSVHDLFDRQAADPGSDPVWMPTVPQDGRNVRLRLERHF